MTTGNYVPEEGEIPAEDVPLLQEPKEYVPEEGEVLAQDNVAPPLYSGFLDADGRPQTVAPGKPEPYSRAVSLTESISAWLGYTNPDGSPKKLSPAEKTFIAESNVGKILNAFGHTVDAYEESAGAEILPVGAMADALHEGGKKAGPLELLHRTLSDSILIPAAAALDYTLRQAGGLYHGAQELGVQAGLDPDIVSIPDAFAGSPGQVIPGASKGSQLAVALVDPLPADTSKAGKAIAELKQEAAAPPSPNPVQYRNTRGEGIQYHGSSKTDLAEVQPDPYHYSSLNYYGQGFYTTDAVDIARGYSKRGSEKTGERNLYKVEIKDPSNLKLYDMEQPLEHDFVKAVNKSNDDIVHQAMDENPKNLRELYDNIRDEAYREGMNADETQEIFDSFAANLEDMGYDGLRHTGGLRTKREPHDVIIFFRPDKTITVSKGAFDEHVITDPAIEIQQAKELGIIGPDRIPVTVGTPAEVAARAAGKEGPNFTTDTEGLGTGGASNKSKRQSARNESASESIKEDIAVDKAGNINLNLINTPEEAKNILRKASDAKGGFQEAQRGEVPLAQLSELSDITGISAKELQTMLRDRARGTTTIQDAETIHQGLIQAHEDVARAMQKTANEMTPENAAAQIDAETRLELIMEQLSGQKSEWGRTGQVHNKYLENQKNAADLSEFIKENTGKTLDDVYARAKGGSILDPRTQLPAYLRAMKKPDAWDKWMAYWTSSILSGVLTQTKYVVFNSAWIAHDTLLVTPIAGAIGAAREAIAGKPVPRVYMGEIAAKAFGIVHGTPDAIVAAWQALKTGVSTPLPGELSTGMNRFAEQRAHVLESKIGQALERPPKHLIASFDTLARYIGYSSEIWGQAYRQAAKSGDTESFASRVYNHARYPNEKMIEAGIENSKRAAFVEEMGPKGKAMQHGIKATRIGQMIVPFMRTLANVMKAAGEGTPYAFVDNKMRGNLLGKNGEIARDTQIARLGAGAAIMAMAVNLALDGKLTDDGPVDPKEKALERLTKEPNSVDIGGRWVALDNFGPAGMLMKLGATFAGAAQSWNKGERAEAGARLSIAAMRIFEQVGTQSLFDFVQAMHDPPCYGPKYWGNLAGSLLPYSSFMRQTASAMDHEMRDVHTFMDGLKNNIPVVRETLFPARDWSGMIRVNKREDLNTLMLTSEKNMDAFDLELQALHIRPTLPDRKIKGIDLTAKQYDDLQDIGGSMIHVEMDKAMNGKGWYQKPPQIRAALVNNIIQQSRHVAEQKIIMTSKGTDNDIWEKAKKIWQDKHDGVEFQN